MTREKWYPTNGTDGDMLCAYCQGCKHDTDDKCWLILRSLVLDMPDEWTAEDCTGRGFQCSRREEIEG